MEPLGKRPTRRGRCLRSFGLGGCAALAGNAGPPL